ncbi:MAG: mechanosensitive ion channel [Candidatus Methanomethylophilaceae archaeon]|nr:mechanosensitive ion channel [Candidatus Methanomethylophilaceae archaeon]NLF34206.1 mechanosensitive ion channel [Thermoplasmatales archaeon]
MRPRDLTFILLSVLLAASMLTAAFSEPSDGSAEESDISIIYNLDYLEVKAGGTSTAHIVVFNILDKATEETEVRVVYISAMVDDGHVESSLDKTMIVVNPGEHEDITLTLHADPYSRDTTDNLMMSFKVVDPDDKTFVIIEDELQVKVSSSLSSGSAYNRIMGVWENPLPAPFNEPLWTAAISFAICILAGLIVSYVVLPLVLHVPFRRKERRAEIVESVGNLILLFVVLSGVTLCLRIGGGGEYLVSVSQTVSAVMFIMIGALVAWRLYRVVIRFLLSDLAKNVDLKGIDESLIPLFKMLGKIGIATIAVAAILATLGFNLYAIITGAGIAGLAVSLGAQSMLQQFFSGVTLLITRPFKPGDMIRLGTDAAMLRVRKVGMMNSQFENWENAELFCLPNNMVTSSRIINMTGENRAYRTLVYMNVAYDTDLKRAQDLMMEAALEHPHVLKDGSFDKPSTRVTGFLDSSVELRLAIYVDEFEDYAFIAGQLRWAIFEKFKANGINVPFPQRDVHIYRHEAGNE